MRESIIEYLIATTQTWLYFENATARIANVSDEIDALKAVAIAITQIAKSANGSSADEVSNLSDNDNANANCKSPFESMTISTGKPSSIT